MSIQALADSVDSFARCTVGLSEPQLDRPWIWRDYDSDGVRFAFFRTLEELRDLAVTVREQAFLRGARPSAAGLILDSYHAAWRGMHSTLLGLEEDDFEQVPAPGEWPLRRVIAHIVDADVGFYTVISETLQIVRAGGPPPHGNLEPAWERVTRSMADDYETLMSGPSEPVLAFDRKLHARILDEFSGITAEELETPSYYWEASPYPLRFRLGRFESHGRQHTVQLYKTRVAIGRPPSESQLLLGLIYAALAEVENAARLQARTIEDLLGPAAAGIHERADEVAAAAN